MLHDDAETRYLDVEDSHVDTLVAARDPAYALHHCKPISYYVTLEVAEYYVCTR